MPLRQGFTCPLDFQTFLWACNVRPKLLESKAFAVLTIKLVQRKVKVGINKDMYCTVLLCNRKALDGIFYQGDVSFLLWILQTLISSQILPNFGYFFSFIFFLLSLKKSLLKTSKSLLMFLKVNFHQSDLFCH